MEDGIYKVYVVEVSLKKWACAYGHIRKIPMARQRYKQLMHTFSRKGEVYIATGSIGSYSQLEAEDMMIMLSDHYKDLRFRISLHILAKASISLSGVGPIA